MEILFDEEFYDKYYDITVVFYHQAGFSDRESHKMALQALNVQWLSNQK